jgi:hypothetical protein
MVAHSTRILRPREPKIRASLPTRVQPAGAGDSIKPGVERSGTPGQESKAMGVRGAVDSVLEFRAVGR